MPGRRAALAMAVADLFTAGLILFGVFVALPARWWPVDSTAAVLAAVQMGAAIGVLARASWGHRLARAASMVALGAGLVTVTALALTASWLSGIYGPVGKGGAIILGFVAVIVLPYLVVLPAVQLLWLGPHGRAAGASAE
jgi:hypothetical protein